jgi:hypothetical protein
VVVSLIGVLPAPAADRVVFDFEDGVQGWKVVEGEFGDLLGKLDFFRNHPNVPFNKQGKNYLTTLDRGGRSTDPMTGVMESPVFVVTGGSMSLLVGGGRHDDTYVALCDEAGNEIYQARGSNQEKLERVTWDTSKLVGKRAFLRLVDLNRGGWGHIAIDDVQIEGKLDPEATARHRAERKPYRPAGVLREPVRAGARPSGTVALPEAAKDPAVAGQPILFVVRPQYAPDHHNTETMFQTGEINTEKFRGPGAIKMVDFGRGGQITTILEVPDGIARDPDVSYDGKRILFSMRRDRGDDYHIYEIGADGSGLKQLTFGSGVSDIDPIHLPDGRILFTATREPKYCMCNRHVMGNLFTMDADGANIQQIGHSTLHEGHAAVLPDGRVLYDRWEYVDRNFGDAQGVWVCNPDGTNHAIHWGNNTNSPGAVLDSRAVPSTDLFIATFSSCHDRPWGALALVDRRLGIDGRPPVVRTWPPDAIDLVGKGDYDTFRKVKPKYEDPFPLSDRLFLCSRQTGEGEQMGIYLIDLEGHETLLHSEPPGCYDPMPLGPRPRETVIPSRVDVARPQGYCYVTDVYVGTGMDAIDRGVVKSIRVVESPEKRYWTGPAWDGGTGQQAPGMAWNDFNNKQILGSAPVEADGSAYFAVPADTFVYFQLLDAKGMMVQSMRSGTIVRPGETVGCVGCHESRRTSAPVAGRLAMKRDPSPLAPWYGPPRLFGYLAEVQPVLDKHCVSCHDYGKEAGKKLNLAGDLGALFNASYVELRGKRYVNVAGAGPYQTMMPKSWGSHASRLTKFLVEGHGDPEIDKQVKLDPEGFDRLITWIDINAPYYPTYASDAYRGNPYGRCPLTQQQLDQLGKLTGMDLSRPGGSIALSFTRPEVSPCLEKLDKSDPKYKEALAILQTGQQMLAGRPRADMPGFQLADETEIRQERKYQERLNLENQMREAIARGIKKYERQPE